MISLKINKNLVFRSLTVFAAIVFFIIILESIAVVLLSMGYSFATAPNSHTNTESSETKYTMEIPTPEPENLYPTDQFAVGDPRAYSANQHMNKKELTLSIPFQSFDGYVERKLFTNQPPIYSVHIKLDAHGRRDTNSSTSTPHNRHLAFFGCSYAFGEAVGPEATLSAHWQQLNPLDKTYNLSFSGYGPHDILARSLSFGFMEDISPKNGVGIYLYTENQIKRSQGAMSVVGNWAPRSAVVEETGDYTFKHVGSHRTARKIRTFLLHLLWKSNIVQLFKIDWPMSITRDDYDRMAREIKGIELLYKQNTSPNNPFVVVIYPSNMIQTSMVLFKDSLEQHKVQFIDYSKHAMETRIPELATVPNDGHPNSAAYKHLAEMLHRDLKNTLQPVETP